MTGGSLAGLLRASESEMEDFYRRWFLPLVRRATWRHGLSHQDATEVVQDAFLLALEKLDPKGNPEAWFKRVVDHLSINWQRKTHRRAALLARWASRDGELMRQPETGKE